MFLSRTSGSREKRKNDLDHFWKIRLVKPFGMECVFLILWITETSSNRGGHPVVILLWRHSLRVAKVRERAVFLPLFVSITLGGIRHQKHRLSLDRFEPGSTQTEQVANCTPSRASFYYQG